MICELVCFIQAHTITMNLICCASLCRSEAGRRRLFDFFAFTHIHEAIIFWTTTTRESGNNRRTKTVYLFGKFF
jgi:hypothetical protein